jgi:hypothetical protein
MYFDDHVRGLGVKARHGPLLGAARGKARLRNQREIHRIFRILSVDHQPKIKVSLGHQLRQQRLDAVIDHRVFWRNPISRIENRKAIGRVNGSALISTGPSASA